MKTYVKEKKGKIVNWNKFLAKENYTIEELDKMSDLAGDWVTCACGNQCSIIDRGEENSGVPTDDKLRELGIKFADCINAMYEFVRYNTEFYRCDPTNELKSFANAKKQAITTLSKIEVRSQYLINKKLEEYKKILKEFGIKKL